MTRKSFSIAEETKFFSSIRTNAVELIQILDNCASVLDVGCGKNSILRFLSCKCERLVGVDAFRPDLEYAKSIGTHDEFVFLDAKNLRQHFRDHEFDACVALDVIEHLKKEEGIRFLHDLETIAKIKVVVFTPNGYLPQLSHELGDYQEHLSGWGPNEMRELGYQVIGMNGLRVFRAKQHQLRFRPAFIWAFLSWMSQKIWCEKHPDSAAALLCWKRQR